MTRTYALKRLLEHGQMTVDEIIDCTKWTRKQVHSTIDALLITETITRDGRYYAIA